MNSGIIKAVMPNLIKESSYTRVEIKNITGFSEIERASFYEIHRQKEETRHKKEALQETRAWDSEKGITFPLRKKKQKRIMAT